MDLKITGNVTHILEEQTGEGRNGTWRKRDFVMEIPGEYPKNVCVTQWGDGIDRSAIQQGETITASIDIQSREYNGRWYTDVKAWKIERPAPVAAGAAPPNSAAIPLPAEPGDTDYSDDDLPF
jgi:hypothetical protein